MLILFAKKGSKMPVATTRAWTGESKWRGKRMLSRWLDVEPGVGALNGAVSFLAAEAKGESGSLPKFSQFGQKEAT